MEKKTTDTLIKSVTIEINGQEITVPVDVARELSKELKDLFEKKAAPFEWPICPQVPALPQIPSLPVHPFPIGPINPISPFPQGPIWVGPYCEPTLDTITIC